ncbi:O-antigen ligase family protein [Rathayibacter rathayi]|uniref:O-antigen ligase family protein n=1 Tax=Rathayibacter rathayi TaxID=33887 RepID=UPI000CE7C6EE|nr:O-antigen ligase family protein [Rathayibacter rathayi]PPG47329.1 hypothetical protein C5C20_00675 [Rathayibacter rathayi]PPH39458.1 hypothetical protein C5C28_00675 [Rathayibacter rathayi]PPI71333.1 hypothetical protein C5E12_07905 [Rathayibacter rathayi]
MGRHADSFTATAVRDTAAGRPSAVSSTRRTGTPAPRRGSSARARPSRQLVDPAQQRREKALLLFLAVLLALSVLQLYTLGPFTAPVAWSLLFLPYLLIRLRGSHVDRVVVLVAFLLVATLFALTYSRTAAVGLRESVSVLSFLSPYLAVRQLGSSAWRIVGRALAWATPVFLVQVALTILFQIDPVQEAAYLHWPGAVLYSDVYVRDIYTIAFNNVLQEKSGGFFLNGNIASMYMATTAMLAFAARRKGGPRVLGLTAVAGLAGALFTLSKTAIVLAIVLPLAVAAVRGLKGRSLGPVAWMIALPASAAAVYSVAEFFPQLAEAGLLTLGARGDFLRLAASAFPEHWLLGLGYGGWEDLWHLRASQFTAHSEVRPPHNLLIGAWANGGLLIAVPVLLLLVTATWRTLRLVLRVEKGQAWAAGGIAVAILWTFLHGMADNTTWFGDQHSLATLAIAVALLSATEAETGELTAVRIPAASAAPRVPGRAPARVPGRAPARVPGRVPAGSGTVRGRPGAR